MRFRRTLVSTFLLGGLMMVFTSCKEQYPPTNLSNHSIIPRPMKVVANHGTFVLKDGATVYYDSGNNELKKTAEYLSGFLKTATGFEVGVEPTTQSPSRGNIFLTGNDSLKESGSYKLEITERLVKISSGHGEGVFYGIQTLRQLFPADIEKTGDETHEKWFLPTGTIVDWPEYEYRGAMLDVARHFFGVETVKRFIDYLAMYKMNVLHLHLSDDQGWRIEIESWPNLAKHGGSTEVGGGPGGFFTKEEYREIVAYASERYITVVPEIDMPGHTNAALSSYPELNCDGKAPELYTGTKVGFSTLCTNKEVVYKFVDDVVGEIAEMTPGPWFHIGGDESHSTAHDDYVRFINRARKIVKSHGKKVIGWDEIAHAAIDGNDVVQFWAKEKNAQLGVTKGAKVIMSPSKHAYMDIKYDSTTVLGLTWAGLTEVDDAYNWDPATLVEGIGKKDIMGVEAPLWSETVEDLKDIEYMVFPRLPGYAEIGWTASEQRSWDEYKVRLGKEKNRFEALGINYYPSPLVPWQEEEDLFIDSAENE
ncbi:beta-N-acetylhexosaminidase [Thermophagus sp. OGC60D27]|uniref:beta-N-acetylhexosaminidase n=1 Tax=Thermophagus sp. OGC60D27 TaxID=3458415 RepID=UPI0040376CFD